MATKFNVSEVLEMAARIEATGGRFYRKAAKLHVSARDLLNDIARQEDMHQKVFAEMRRELTPGEQGNLAGDLYGDTDLYLKAMVENQSFDINKDPSEFITGQESLADIFNIAIGLEKDSIIFYLGLKQLVPPSMGKEKIDAIVKEEMKHVAWLNQKRTELGLKA